MNIVENNKPNLNIENWAITHGLQLPETDLPQAPLDSETLVSLFLEDREPLWVQTFTESEGERISGSLYFVDIGSVKSDKIFRIREFIPIYIDGEIHSYAILSYISSLGSKGSDARLKGVSFLQKRKSSFPGRDFKIDLLMLVSFTEDLEAAKLITPFTLEGKQYGYSHIAHDTGSQYDKMINCNRMVLLERKS